MIRIDLLNFLIIGAFVTLWRLFWLSVAAWQAHTPVGQAASLILA